MHKKIVNRKKKSTNSVNCFTNSTSNVLNSNDNNVSPIAKRFVDINYNIESISKAAGSTFEAIKNRVLWKKRSVTLTEYDPVYKVIYLGNVLTPWAKGLEALEKPLATLWKNYCINGSKAEIFMRITLMKSGMIVVTREHGKTSYEFNRICYISTHVKYPRIFAFVYRHPGKKLKNEIRCHAVLCSKEEDAINLHTQLKHRLTVALSEFKRNLRMKQNARVLLTKALECHQSICSEQNGISQAIKCCSKCHRVDDERSIEGETSLLRASNNVSPSELSFNSSTCTRRYSDSSSLRRQHGTRGTSDFSNDCTATDSVDSTHSHSHSGLLSLTSSSLCEDYNCTDKTNSLVSTRSSNSSSRSSPSSISSCSCSAGSASASMCQCSRSSKKRRSTSSLNSSSCTNCTAASSFNMYTGKAGNSLIPVRKKHLMRGQSIFKAPLERSKSAPRLTSIDEEDDDDIDLTDSSSQSSYSDDDVDDDEDTPVNRVTRTHGHTEITFDDDDDEQDEDERQVGDDDDDDDYTISMNQCSLVDSIQANQLDNNTGPHNQMLNVRSTTDDSLTLGNIYHSQETTSSTSLPTTPRPTAKCYQYILGTI